MPQGKLKVKAKLPASVKIKKVKNKGMTKRANCPVAPKAKKNPESLKLKKELLKTINESMEKELRSKARSGSSTSKLGKKAGNDASTTKKK